MIREIHTTPPADIGNGEVALLFCEAILHVLVERGVLTKNDVLEALDNLSGVVAEMHEGRAHRATIAAGPRTILETMHASFEVK